MNETWIAVFLFLSLSFAALFAMLVAPSQRGQYLTDETSTVVRLMASMFIVMSSLVFGLMINSAKNTLDDKDDSLHAFSTKIILLDRSLKDYGQVATEARGRLLTYLEQAVDRFPRTNMTKSDDGRALYAVGDSISTLRSDGELQRSLLIDIRQQYRRLVEERWIVVDGAGGTIPSPLLFLLAGWLTFVFAAFGYRAPRHRIAVGSFVISAFLIAAAFYFVLDMDTPFHGPIRLSDEPLRRALAELASPPGS